MGTLHAQYMSVCLMLSSVQCASLCRWATFGCAVWNIATTGVLRSVRSSQRSLQVFATRIDCATSHLAKRAALDGAVAEAHPLERLHEENTMASRSRRLCDIQSLRVTHLLQKLNRQSALGHLKINQARKVVCL